MQEDLVEESDIQTLMEQVAQLRGCESDPVAEEADGHLADIPPTPEDFFDELAQNSAHLWLHRKAQADLKRGIPACCAIFGVIYHHGGDGVHDDPRDEYELWVEDHGVDPYDGYVPCPRCLMEQNLVELPDGVG